MRQTRSRWTRRPPARRRQGTFLIITVAALFLFMGLVTLVADFGYTFAERQRVQGVLDMAGMTTLLTVDPVDTATGLASVQEILGENAVDPSIVTSVVVVNEGRGANITIDAVIPISALFGNVFGMTEYSAAVTSMTTAVRRQLPQPARDGFGLFGCSSLTISDPMGSFDSAVGPNDGPPVGFPTITSCDSGGTNCGDELLIGSNGDVLFKTGQVWGNVVAGGNITAIDVDPNQISKDARAGGTITGVTVGGQAFEGEPFEVLDCEESAFFPDHFLETTDPSEGATHTHGTNTFTKKREVETDAMGNDTDSDGEMDGTGSPGSTGSLTSGFTIDFSGIPAINGPREYTLGNRVGEGTGTENGFTDADEDIMFHNSPVSVIGPGAAEGNEGDDGMGMVLWPLDITLGDEAGGWIWNKDKNLDAYFRTGVTYFFHEIHLNGTRTHNFLGDFDLDGPVVWFIHGNGQTAGDDDFKGNNATFTYTGQCGGMACTSGQNLPALRVYATDDSVLRMAGNYTFSVDITAPKAIVDMNGTAGVLGRIIADVVDMTGTADFTFDVQLLEGDVDQPFILERPEFARIIY